LEFELRAGAFATEVAARARVTARIDGYNRCRRYCALRMMAPADYEKSLQAGEAALMPQRLAPPSIGRCSAGCSSAGLTALRALHLNTTRAPALTWQLAGSAAKTRSARPECARFQGTAVSRFLTRC
jgi:hypothetical protein